MCQKDPIIVRYFSVSLLFFLLLGLAQAVPYQSFYPISDDWVRSTITRENSTEVFDAIVHEPEGLLDNRVLGLGMPFNITIELSKWCNSCPYPFNSNINVSGVECISFGKPSAGDAIQINKVKLTPYGLASFNRASHTALVLSNVLPSVDSWSVNLGCSIELPSSEVVWVSIYPRQLENIQVVSPDRYIELKTPVESLDVAKNDAKWAFWFGLSSLIISVAVGVSNYSMQRRDNKKHKGRQRQKR